MKFSAIFLFLLLTFWSKGQNNVCLKITKLPANHPQSDKIYVAGNFNNWNPADANYLIDSNQIKFVATGTIEFKFTRGSWQKVEKGKYCEEIKNRSIAVTRDTVVEIKIENWADLCSFGSNHSAATNVKIINDSFFIPQLQRYRRIWVYLPPDYESSFRYYPVIYMNDGQNLFDAYYSFAGEWAVDESLNSLFAKDTSLGYIVVGIDNGGVNRLNEYSPWKNPNYGGGEGEYYVDFIVNTLKPFIDSQYRTKKNASDTYIGGSSMGGLISFYAILAYPEIFGKAIVFSPSFWFSDSCYLFAQNFIKKDNLKIYFLAGGKESGVYENCVRMSDILYKNGFGAKDIKIEYDANGQHNELFWKKYFPEAVKWLKESDKKKANLFPNPAQNEIFLNYNNSNPINYKIFSNTGTKIMSGSTLEKIELHNLSKGLYIIEVDNGEKLEYLKFVKD